MFRSNQVNRQSEGSTARDLDTSVCRGSEALRVPSPILPLCRFTDPAIPVPRMGFRYCYWREVETLFQSCQVATSEALTRNELLGLRKQPHSGPATARS